MKISRFIVNPFGENTYILWEEARQDAIIIDPGMLDDDERNAVDGFIEKNQLIVRKVILTHQHADHILSAQYVSDKYEAPIYANIADNYLGEHLQEQADMFGLRCKRLPLVVTNNIKDGDVLKLNSEDIIVLEVPGHSRGGLSFYIPQSCCIFVGDSLFAQSIGRTDLPGGDYEQLLSSIKTKLYPLPEETVVHPGHGGATTIGEEKLYNPYTR